MVSAAEQLAANLNFGALAKAEELKKRIWFTLGALLVYRLGTYIPLPGIDPSAWEQIFRTQAGGILGMFNMFAGGGIQRMAIFALNIMPYISASIIIQLMTTVVADPRAAQERGRAGPQDDQPVHPLSHRRAGGVPGLRHLDRARRRRQRRVRSGLVLPHLDPDHADRRHHVPDVARRADHLARHRQRHLADHPRRHRGGAAVGAVRHVRARPPGRALDRHHPRRHPDVGRGDRLHRVHGARAAPAADPVSQAPGRQPDVRGPVLASAAQAQHLGRDPADLRLLAAAAADHGRELQCRAGRRGHDVDHHAPGARAAAVPGALHRR